MVHQEGPFNTRIKWAIKIQKDRSVRHELNIEIFNIRLPVPSIPQRIAIQFEPDQSVYKCETFTNNQSCRDKFLLQEDGTKLFFCELSEIISKYRENVPGSIRVLVTFLEKNALIQAGPIYLPYFHYHCSDMKAYHIDVTVYLPRISLHSYLWRMLFTEITHRGVYQIYEIEAGKANTWYKMEGRLQPALWFIDQRTNSVFPLVGFAYKPTGKVDPLTLFIRLLLLFFLFIVGIAGSVLANKQWVVAVFNKFVNLLTKFN